MTTINQTPLEWVIIAQDRQIATLQAIILGLIIVIVILLIVAATYRNMYHRNKSDNRQ